jgi:TonB family protein
MHRLRVVLFSGFFVACSAIASMAQDVHLRQEAEGLLERADSLSAPSTFHSYEQTITFRSYSDNGVKDGQFTSVVQGPRSYRDEYVFGDYRLLVVVHGTMVADVGDRARAPVEVRRMTRLNRPYTARFDDSDVVRSIQDREVNSRPARCIEFDTIRGDKTAANELCIDKQTSLIARVHANEETITNSDFFPYRNTYVPAHIVYEQNGLHIELEQTKTVTDGPFDADFLTPPAGARMIGKVCTSYRRPFGQFMPQPKPGQGGVNADVMVHVTVRTDGAVREPGIDVSERSDLNPEALQIASGWRFTPATCNGTPLEIPAEITLHFQNR